MSAALFLFSFVVTVAVLMGALLVIIAMIGAYRRKALAALLGRPIEHRCPTPIEPMDMRASRKVRP